MAVQLYQNQRVRAGEYVDTGRSDEMTGLRVIFRWTVINTGSTLFSGRGSLRDGNGRVLVTQDAAAEVGQTVVGETVYDGVVPPGAYVDLTAFTGSAAISVDAVDLDPPVNNLAGTGWANYNHSGAVQAVPRNVWTTLLNDGAGVLVTTDKTFLPIGVDDVYDCANSRMDMGHVVYGTQMMFRFDVTVNPSQNNRNVRVRLLFNDPTIPATWSFEGKRLEMRDGAGVNYTLVEAFEFFVASFWSDNLTITPQIIVTTDSNITVGGWYIRMH